MPELKDCFMKVYCLLLNRSMKGLQSHFIKSFEQQKTTVRVIFHKKGNMKHCSTPKQSKPKLLQGASTSHPGGHKRILDKI